MSTRELHRTPPSGAHYTITNIPSDTELIYLNSSSHQLMEARPDGDFFAVDLTQIKIGRRVRFLRGEVRSDFGFDNFDFEYYRVIRPVGDLPNIPKSSGTLMRELDVGGIKNDVAATKGEHYPKLDPWKLQQEMTTSGNAFVDARRCDTIKYAFRMKGDKVKLLDDLKKARHCIDAAIKELGTT